MPNSDINDVSSSEAPTARNLVSSAAYSPYARDGATQGAVHIHRVEAIHLPQAPIPQELPAVPCHFTNRERELNELDHALAVDRGSRLPIFVITGTGGIGKTALATWWSKRLSHMFRDGVLYEDMGAFDPREPLSVKDVLGHFLRSLGTPPEAIPIRTEERSALFRTVTAAKELLIFLDNATSAKQVRYLLPASMNCVVIVTARSRLDSLVIDGARLLSLGPLDEVSGLDLLYKVLGSDRLSGELSSTSKLVVMCGGLPIALCIVAARLASRPRLTVGKVADELSGEYTRLNALSIGEEESVQMVFDLSYRGLPRDAARLYRILGLHPGNNFGRYAAAAAAGRTSRQTDELLDILVAANLLEELDAERYQFHDLVRLHARHHAKEEDDYEDRTAAIGRMLDYYTFMANKADQFINLLGRPGDPVDLVPRNVPNVDSHAEAIAWFGTEYRNLLAAVKLATDTDEVRRAIHLSRASIYYLRLKGYWSEALDLCQCMVEFCSNINDDHGLADLRFYCADIYRLAGALSEAQSWYESALSVYQELGEHYREARVLHSIGDIERANKEYDSALWRYETALAIYREIPHPHAETRALHSIADTYFFSGRYDEALNIYRRILETYRELNDKVGEARVVHSIGDIIARFGDHNEALEYCNRALTAYRALGDHLGEADALRSLGDINGDMEQLSDAIRSYENCLAIYRSLGNRRSEGSTLRRLGNSFARSDRRDEAVVSLHQALSIFESIGIEEADAVRTEIEDLSPEGRQ